MEFSNFNARNDLRTFRVNGVPVSDDTRRFDGYRGSGIDIADTVQAEHTEARLLSAIHQRPDAIAIFYKHDHLETYNIALAQNFLRGADVEAGETTIEALLRNNKSLLSTVHDEQESFIASRVKQHQRAEGTVQQFALRSGK